MSFLTNQSESTLHLYEQLKVNIPEYALITLISGASFDWPRQVLNSNKYQFMRRRIRALRALR